MTAQANPYVKVYYSIAADPKFRGMKLDVKGAWLDLLILADSTYPVPAPLPRWLSRRHQDELVERGLVDLHDEERFTIHGLAAEREKRASVARAGGVARANAQRQHSVSTSGESANAQPTLASPIHSSPLLSAPLQSRAVLDTEREGWPHLTPEATRAIEGIAGWSITVASDSVLTELDRLLERHGDRVMDAMSCVVKDSTIKPTWPQLVYGARNRLDPISRPDPKAEQERDREEAERRRWKKSMEANRRRAEELFGESA